MAYIYVPLCRLSAVLKRLLMLMQGKEKIVLSASISPTELSKERQSFSRSRSPIAKATPQLVMVLNGATTAC